MNSKLCALIFLFIFSGGLFAGEIYGLIKHSDTGKAMPNVIVKIEGSEISAYSDSEGKYILEGLPDGKYYLIFMAKSCYTLVLPDIEVKAGAGTKLNVDMYPGDEQEFLFLEIGGIQVTADRELIANEPETVRRITTGEIEHMQANSLADVLDRLPGIERKNNPGLGKRQSLSLRSFDNAADNQASLFGTKIIIDDVPLTTNTDLNTGTGVGYGSNVTTAGNKGGQYDLREIVAENIEKIEVMSGATSVEYGDHSQGLVLVTTRTRNVPHRLKIKSNPDTREANLMGGFRLSSTELVYNFNYGFSERNIRIQGDEYHRIGAQLNTNNHFMGEKLTFRQKFQYGRKIEEDNDDSDPDRTKAYNRDHHFVYSHTFDYQPNNVSSVYIRNFVDYRRRNSWLNKLESADLAYITDRVTPGTREGIISKPYYRSDVLTIGDEWSVGSKFRYRRQWMQGNALHHLLAGAEFNWEKNYGQGKMFDLLLPPNGRMGIRPRTFDDIPQLLQTAFFIEDRITCEWLIPFTVNLGMRIDSYNPTTASFTKLLEGKDFFQASQGTFFNPRLGVKVKLLPRLQVRLNFSKSSKIPALSAMYPETYYLDVYDHTIKTIQGPGGERDTNITLVSTYLAEKYSQDLKGYQNTKWEAAVDYQWNNLGFSLTGYYQKTDGIPTGVELPYIYSSYYWPNWPSEFGKTSEMTVTTKDTKYKITHNLKWTIDRGVEFEFRTHRIKSLNMFFRINAAYKHRQYGSQNYKAYGSIRVYTQGDTLNTGWIPPADMQVMPYYRPYESWNQKLVINYFADYLYKPLGIWFTFKAQQVLLEERLNKKDPTTSAEGYFYNNRFYTVDAETSYLMQLDRTHDKLSITVDDSKAHAKWLFGVVVSKSLFKGADVSIFIENIFNDRGYYLDRQGYYRSRNPEIFWGIAFSSKLDDIF